MVAPLYGRNRLARSSVLNAEAETLVSCAAMSTPRRLLALSAGLLAVTAVVGLTLAIHDSAPTRRLPNGEVIRLQAVTYGTQHQWAPQPAWRRLLGPVLPPPSPADIYRANYFVDPNRKPFLVFWTTHMLRNTRITRGQRAFAVDEEGREYAHAPSLYTMKRGGPLVEYYSVPIPRRGRSITLRFYGQGTQVAAEFSVPLPGEAMQDRLAAPPPAALSGAQACPIMNAAGDLQVTLEQVRTNLYVGQRRFGSNRVLLSEVVRPAANGERRWCAAALRVTRDGKPALDWNAQHLRLTDGEGHSAGGGPFFKHLGYDYAEVPGFMADGPLRVSVTLRRLGLRSYRPDDCWSIPRVAVPGQGAETRLNQTFTRHGVQVSVASLAGLGTPVLGGRRNGVEAVPYLRIHATAVRSPQLLTVWAVDPAGKRYDTDLPAYWTSGGRELRVRLHLPRGVRQVDLHFAVHSGFETRNVEFTALPSPGN